MKKTDYLKQVSDKETAIIIDLLRKVLVRGVSGDVVEFGCYRGDTSLLIEKELEKADAKNSEIISNSEASVERRGFWIYDSFEGLPAKTKEDASVAGDGFSEGELLISKREVVERFKKTGLRVPRVRKGFFENLDPGKISASGEVLRSSADIPDKICFAFLDGDLYQSIKTSLELVAPRLVRDETGKIQSVIIVHDYNNPQLPGVAKAVDEWLANFDRVTNDVAAPKTAPRLQRRESLAIISW